ncbi:serine/threonine protein kinase [Wenzhouxiangella sp. XN79A]|uniref:serine/threonine protein kinase n=1 Tax=Wenzhouxiangella sp. XN79A TaxID=2724193 RepID=UPI00144AEEA0|nr:serine/threonine protein kinase [Wenzhouxiangella sp. XN79A]NKI35642.1 serine/threonine protein kinase [Wenzhouxiangella sp. XN79A]
MDSRTDAHPFAALTPDAVLEAAESAGLSTDGRLLALNSYENRVWQIGIEDGVPVIGKFYRPDRWNEPAILEEHAFAAELAAAGLSVVAPMAFDGKTLLEHAGFRYALFPRQGGHAPEPEHEDTLKAIGHALGRMHAVGAARPFEHRETLTPDALGREPRDWLLDHDWIPMHLESAFKSLTDDALAHVESAWSRIGEIPSIRLHGDCHPGNILWRDAPHFVDLDDCRMGPAVQDLWMLISGEREWRERQWGWLLDEYSVFMDFDARELALIEPLRVLRMIHYQAWLARRWDDPAFPMAFPWFEDDRHWETVITQLREQLSELQEPAVTWHR